MRRTLDHWLKQNGKYMLAIFANWKAIANINDKRQAIAQMEYQMGDMAIV